MLVGIAGRLQLHRKPAQLQSPEISSRPDQCVRLTTDFLEIVVVDKTPDIGNALGRVVEKHI